MRYKKIIILTILLVSLLAVSAVSAAENATEDIGVEETTNDVSIDENQVILKENNVGTFTDLTKDIADAKGTLNLNRNYAYTDSDSDYKNGITIDKKITINGNGYAINGNNQVRAFGVDASDVILNNINFVNCSVENSPDESGGAIRWNGDNGALSGCSFVNCFIYSSSSNEFSYSRGGAVCWYGDNGSLSDCNFENCYSNSISISSSSYYYSSYSYGGAVCWKGIGGSLLNCNFVDCYSSSSSYKTSSSTQGDSFSYSYGGAVYWNRAGGTLRNCNFVNCHASYNGGAVSWSTGDGYLSNCSFADCSCEYDGGAVYWSGDHGTLNDCNFADCQAYNSIYANRGSGGAVCWSGDNGILSASTFIDCHSKIYGGGIYFKGSDCRLIRASFEGCTAKNGSDWYGEKPVIVINKTLTVLSAPAVSITYGTSKNLIVTLTDVDKNALAGEQISINLNNVENTLKTNSKGQVSLAIPTNLAPKTYIATITYAGTDEYTPSTTTANVIVNKAGTALTASDVTTTYNSGKNLVATLKDANGKAISGAKVTVKLGTTTKTLTTDKNGQVSVTTNGLDYNTYTATITFAGDDTYSASSTTAKVTITKEKQQAKVYLRNALYFVLQTKMVQVTLWDANNNPIAGKTVYINLDEYSLKYSGVTDENGNAYIRVGVGFGNHAATVSFEGDDVYNPDSKTGRVRVIKETPSLMLPGKYTKFKATDPVKTVKIYLKDRYDKPLLPGTKVFIKVNGQTYSGLIDLNGIAYIDLKINTKGTYNTELIYTGNTAYNAVRKTTKITIV